MDLFSKKYIFVPIVVLDGLKINMNSHFYV